MQVEDEEVEGHSDDAPTRYLDNREQEELIQTYQLQANKINRSWSMMLCMFGMMLTVMMAIFIYQQYANPLYLKHHRL
jgi:hypothetical protein